MKPRICANVIEMAAVPCLALTVKRVLRPILPISRFRKSGAGSSGFIPTADRTGRRCWDGHGLCDSGALRTGSDWLKLQREVPRFHILGPHCVAF